MPNRNNPTQRTAGRNDWRRTFTLSPFFYAASILAGNASVASCLTPYKELRRRPGQHFYFLVAHAQQKKENSCRLDRLPESLSLFGNKNPPESPNLPACAFFWRDIQRFGRDTASRFNLHTHHSPTAQALEEFHWFTATRSSGVKHPYCASWNSRRRISLCMWQKVLIGARF